MRFAERVAIVTGAASGMGLRSAQRLAEEGARVVLTDVNEDAVTQAATEIGPTAVGLAVDVRDWGQVTGAVALAVERFGRVDILVNCAGGAAQRVHGRTEPWHEMPIEVIDWGLDVNLKGALYFAKAVLGPMIERGSGVIVSLGSVEGVTGTKAIDYGAAKCGIMGMTKSLAIYGAPHGIRACCVSPGPVMTRPAMANMKTRLGRAAEPDEVVSLILYLCSDEAAFITGANYRIDGGRSVGALE